MYEDQSLVLVLVDVQLVGFAMKREQPLQRKRAAVEGGCLRHDEAVFVWVQQPQGQRVLYARGSVDRHQIRHHRLSSALCS